MLRARVALLLFASACAHTPGAATSAPVPERAPACLLPPEPTAAELIQQYGTALDRYQLEGGAWLDQAPVLVNEDFDFALAMGMEGGVGAGLAAAKRRENRSPAQPGAHIIPRAP